MCVCVCVCGLWREQGGQGGAFTAVHSRLVHLCDCFACFACLRACVRACVRSVFCCPSTAASVGLAVGVWPSTGNSAYALVACLLEEQTCWLQPK
ncbi:hypothetical protein BD289DRAFT_426431 [Coniella lustricola]|uniref:Uncharacterized protein n=1 Tax=Coniella lustricola TaxID=2025994 RepID=A0A2T3AFY4_9PEZI|nr:hypothetical protein BD289DRAFT_426431 [Coniella lustricola]